MADDATRRAAMGLVLGGNALKTKNSKPESTSSQYTLYEEKNKVEDKNDDLLEKLASLEHDQWFCWAKDIIKSESISEERAKRWKEECFKPYEELSEEMKEYDREWARKVLNIVTKSDKDLLQNADEDVEVTSDLSKALEEVVDKRTSTCESKINKVRDKYIKNIDESVIANMFGM